MSVSCQSLSYLLTTEEGKPRIKERERKTVSMCCPVHPKFPPRESAGKKAPDSTWTPDTPSQFFLLISSVFPHYFFSFAGWLLFSALSHFIMWFGDNLVRKFMDYKQKEEIHFLIWSAIPIKKSQGLWNLVTLNICKYFKI